MSSTPLSLLWAIITIAAVFCWKCGSHSSFSVKARADESVVKRCSSRLASPIYPDWRIGNVLEPPTCWESPTSCTVSTSMQKLVTAAILIRFAHVLSTMSSRKQNTVFLFFLPKFCKHVNPSSFPSLQARPTQKPLIKINLKRGACC